MKFHLGDLLTITTGRLVSPSKIEGVYKILNHMTGDNLYTHQLGRATDECAPWLRNRYPFLDSPEVAQEVKRLIGCLELNDKADHPAACKNWLEFMVSVYGEWFEVDPIPQDEHRHIDPLVEAEQMVGKDKVITVEVPS